MTLTNRAIISCDGCSSQIRGRLSERPSELRDRAKRSGWKWEIGGRFRDFCQVCARKDAKED